MISTSQKEHLTYSLILQIAILVGIWIVVWNYIIPGFTKISKDHEKVITTIEKYNTVKTSWLTFEELWAELAKLKWKEELLKIIDAAKTEARNVIVKTDGWDYLEWLERTINESSIDKNNLRAVKMLINSILPTLSPSSSNIDEEYMTLKSYIQFIEKKFLEKYKINSNIVLWVQWISYWADPLAKNVWNFELRLDFQATNNDIQDLITFINESWNPSYLTWNQLTILPEDTDNTIRAKVLKLLKTEDSNSVLLTNPLMTIEALSLENTLDANNPDLINNWRITIRFYVRGSSQEDIVFLRESIVTRKDELSKKIKDVIKECDAQELLCAELTKLKSFEKKYNEFLRSLVWANWIESGDILVLSQTSTSLRALDDEFKNIIKK